MIRVKFSYLILLAFTVVFVSCHKENQTKGWEKTFGGVYDDWGLAVQQTKDDGYIITGETRNFGSINVYLLKIDAEGNFQWHRAFSGSDIARGNAVR